MIEISPDIKDAIEELKQNVLQIAGDDVKKIILFGSYARGDYDSESDVDIMILVDGDNSKKYDHDILDMQTVLSIKYEKVIMPLFYNYEDFIANNMIMPLYKNVVREGVVLYDAA